MSLILSSSAVGFGIGGVGRLDRFEAAEVVAELGVREPLGVAWGETEAFREAWPAGAHVTPQPFGSGSLSTSSP